MPNSDLPPSLLYKINQNQRALDASIMELTLWGEQHGSAEVGGNAWCAGNDRQERRFHRYDSCDAHGTGVIYMMIRMPNHAAALFGTHGIPKASLKAA